jgi:AbrB family looped-hinge helix DNA binding protein
MCNTAFMVLARSKITAQGQISVPYTIRKRLGLGPGSVLEWEDENGQIVVKRSVRYTSEDIHSAIFAAEPKPRTLAELKEGIADDIRNRHAKR